MESSAALNDVDGLGSVDRLAHSGAASRTAEPFRPEPHLLADGSLVVYSWPKNASEEVLATLSMFRGHRLADVRIYFADENDELRPTRKGLAIRIEDLPRLAAAVDALLEAAGMGRAAA